MNLSIEHVLLFGLVVCALYYLMGGCDCKEGFVYDNSGIKAAKQTMCPKDEEFPTSGCWSTLPDGQQQSCIIDTRCKDVAGSLKKKVTNSDGTPWNETGCIEKTPCHYCGFGNHPECCELSKYGCCADGKTPASAHKGGVYDNCNSECNRKISMQGGPIRKLIGAEERMKCWASWERLKYLSKCKNPRYDAARHKYTCGDKK
uniref:Uncharacterized protein n=1 Tax=viral metagenome TaxID=1070528 RepID=A0A6C0FEI0_9ZZZZ|tara:strand:+ start:2686 stop:3291 length:606 start_codon:yes stop_codon:yes gene_type:complete